MPLKLPVNFEPVLRQAFGVRRLVFLLGKIAIVAAVWFAYEMGNNLRPGNRQSLPEIDLKAGQEEDTGKERASLASYAVIAQRNLFNIKKQEDAAKPAQVTSLSLRLVGTNLSPEGSMAIIEDTKTKNQDVFEVNEQVFDQAKLVRVFQDSVKLERNGKEEVLPLQDAEGTAGTGGAELASAPAEDKTEFAVAEEELTAELSNLPRLLSQARAVPYFRNGKSIGMRLFAIRSGSIYEKLGLKNGDIIKAVNNTSLSDPTQALRLFEQLKNEKSISVQTERAGQDVPLSYTIR